MTTVCIASGTQRDILGEGPLEFSGAGPEHADSASGLAGRALVESRSRGLSRTAQFLETIPQEVVGLGDALIEYKMAETALLPSRLEGERARTLGQLRLFANVVRNGEFPSVVADKPLPDCAPLPWPELRMWCVPFGLVAVFGASKFQFALSVVSRDTASSFAGICEKFRSGTDLLCSASSVVCRAVCRAGSGFAQASVALCGIIFEAFLIDSDFSLEVFGASAFAVPRGSIHEIREAIRRLEGQLTVTIDADHEENAVAADLAPMLERKAGRLVVKGLPTGIEVAAA